MFYFAALVAASAALTGCSSDDDLSAAQPAGVPFGVSASVASDQTRGVDLTASTFDQFYLYGDDGNGTSWFTGDEFTPSGDDWTDGSTTTWRDGTWNFYAVTPSAPTSTTFTADASQFDYTEDNTDVTNQEDLMVAKATGLSSDDGKINLQFYHALANIKVSVRFVKGHFDYDESDPDEGKYYAKIQSITFHNIKKQGTYDFSANAWSTNQSEYANYTLNVDPNSWGSNGIDSEGYISFTDNDDYVPLTFEEGSLFVIPQTITPWGTTNETAVPLTTADSNNNSYISIECQIYNTTVDDTNADPIYANYWVHGGGTYDRPGQRNSASFGTLYFPLKLSANELLFNKTHHLKITLEGGFRADGKRTIDDATFDIGG